MKIHIIKETSKHYTPAEHIYTEAGQGKVTHRISFKIAKEDIPNWDIISTIPAVQDMLLRYICTDKYIIFHARGMAVCKMGDKWDVTKGEHIAQTKAQMAMHRKLKTFFKNLTAATYSIAYPIFDLVKHHNKKGHKCLRHLWDDVYNDKTRKYIKSQQYYEF